MTTKTNKYFDYNTKNKSFIDLSNHLSDLGVKNSKFMLQLNDLSLKDADPFSDKLTTEQMENIITECRNNLWYYLREICRIPLENDKSIQYEANKGNIAQAWCILHRIDNCLNMLSGLYTTESTLAVIIWIFLFGFSNSSILLNGGERMLGERDRNITKAYNLFEKLPTFIQKAYFNEKNIITKYNMKYISKQNMITTPIKIHKIEDMYKLSVYSTSDIIFFENFHHTLEDSYLLNHSNGLNILTVKGCIGDNQDLINGMAGWTEKMYDWTEKECLDYLHTNSNNDILYIEHSYKNIFASSWQLEKYINEMLLKSNIIKEQYDKTNMEMKIML